MADTLTGELKVQSTWNFENSLSNSTTEDSTTYKLVQSWTDGTSTNNVNQMWHDRRTVTLATGSDDLDLAGSLTNAFGNTVTFATVREIVVYNRSTTAGEDLYVGAATSNALSSLFEGSTTAKITVRASGIFVISAPLDGYTVTAGSADVLRVNHSGSVGDITYDIIIKGTE